MAAVIPTDDFYLSIAAASAFGAFSIGSLRIFGPRCKKVTDNEHKMDRLSKNKGTREELEKFDAITAELEKHKLRQPLYVMCAFIFAMICDAILYGLGIGGIAVFNIGTNLDPINVYLNRWIALAISGSLYMFSSMWIIEAKLYQAVIAALLSATSILFIFATEMIQENGRGLQVFFYLVAGISAIGSFFSIRYPVNFVNSSQNGNKRTTSRRLIYITIPLLVYFLIYVIHITGPLFDVDKVTQFAIGLFVFLLIVFISLVYFFHFLLALFKRAMAIKKGKKKTQMDTAYPSFMDNINV